MIVVDASVAVKWLVEEEGHQLALRLLEKNFSVIAPDLIFSETANVLWKKLRRGEVTPEQAERGCRALPSFFEGVVSTASLVENALALARQFDHPVYDCVYLACAQQQGTKLVTADQKFVSHLKNRGSGHLVIALEELRHAQPRRVEGWTVDIVRRIGPGSCTRRSVWTDLIVCEGAGW